MCFWPHQERIKKAGPKKTNLIKQALDFQSLKCVCI